MTDSIQCLSFDRAISHLGERSIADFQAVGAIIAALYGVSTEYVSQAVQGHWERTDPWSIVNGKVLVRVGADGALLRVGAEGESTLVEFGTATEGNAVLGNPAALVAASRRLKIGTIGDHLAEVRGWLEHIGFTVVGG